MSDDLSHTRKSVYAALLLHSTEAGTLRERALDQLTLLGLADSSPENPYKSGEIRSGLAMGGKQITIRPEVLRESLQRLIDRRKVSETEVRTKSAFFLLDEGKRDLAEAVGRGEQRFAPVLRRMAGDVAASCDEAIAAEVFQKFIAECYCLSGARMARVVTGQLDPSDFSRSSDASEAFAAAVTGNEFTVAQHGVLRARALAFIQSLDPDDVAIKFHLTQAFYISYLLGVGETDFNPIASDAFGGSSIYIDTNVLLRYILNADADQGFIELTRVAARLGISLRVTRSTVDEAREAANDRVALMEQLLEKLPKERVALAADDIVQAFASEHQKSGLTPKKFVDQFDDIPHLLERYGITFEDGTTDEAIGSRDVDRLCEIVSETANETRGYRKGERISRHDVAHLLLVEKARSSGARAWFLTRDRSLIACGSRATSGSIPPCIMLTTLLQSLSPFLSSETEERTVRGLFGAILNDEVAGMTRRGLFDMQELKLLAEFADDIQATPAEKLVQALEFARTSALGGAAFRERDSKEFSLGLRKFLVASGDERELALRDQIAVIESGKAAEHAKRQAVEIELTAASLAFATEAAEKEKLLSRALASEARAQGRSRRAAALLAIGTLFFSLVLWFFDDGLSEAFAKRFGIDDRALLETITAGSRIA